MATNGTFQPQATTVSPNTTYSPGISVPPVTIVPSGSSYSPVGPLQNGTFPNVFGDPNAGLETDGSEDANFDNVTATPVFLPAQLRPYEKASATESMAGIPRFGHSNDFARIALLASGENKSDGVDYLLGLLFVGCFLLVFFLIWTLVILIFKTSLQGFLSGEPFTNPHISNPESPKLKEEKYADEDDLIEDSSWLATPRRVRITFLICGFLQIIFAILLVTQGVANLQNTTDTIQSSTSTVTVLVDETLLVAKTLKQLGSTGLLLRDQIVFDLDKDNFCPDNPAFAQSPAGQSMLGAGDGTIGMLKQLGGFIDENVITLEETLTNARQNIYLIDQSTEDIESMEWLGGLIAFPYLILATIMMVGTAAAHLKTMTGFFLCFLNWVVLPVFVFVVIMSYVVLAAISIAASFNADFCGGKSGTPDQVIVNLMLNSGLNKADLVFQTVRYYVNQCTQSAETDPFLFMRNFDGTIAQGRQLVVGLTKTMEDISLQQLALGCNRDFRPLQRYLEQMLGVLDALLQSLNQVINLISCERVVPIYANIVYDATCKYSVGGFTWIFSSLLIISATGMIMLMLRSSYQNTVFEKTPEVIDENTSVPVLDDSDEFSDEDDRGN